MEESVLIMPKVIESEVRDIVLKVQEFFKKERQHKGPIIPYHKLNERLSVATGMSIRAITNELNQAKPQAPVIHAASEKIEATITPTSSINTSSEDSQTTKGKKSKKHNVKPYGLVDVLAKVKEFFKLEKDEKGPIVAFEQVNNRVAVATGISVRTVTRIATEGKLAATTQKKIVPTGKHRKPRKDKISYDYSVLRQKIQELQMRNEAPTITKVHRIIREELGLKGSREIVRRHIKAVLSEMKGPETATPNNNVVPNPNPANDNIPNVNTAMPTSSFGIIHPTNTNVDNMNLQYMKHNEHQYKPPSFNPERCLIKIPNVNSKKSEIMEYLAFNNLQYSEEYTKQQLLDIAKCYNPESMYSLDRITTERPRSPITLYNCDFPDIGHTVP